MTCPGAAWELLARTPPQGVLIELGPRLTSDALDGWTPEKESTSVSCQREVGRRRQARPVEMDVLSVLSLVKSGVPLGSVGGRP